MRNSKEVDEKEKKEFKKVGKKELKTKNWRQISQKKGSAAKTNNAKKKSVR